jgi:DNA-binding XRE family transcriptional regulator
MAPTLDGPDRLLPWIAAVCRDARLAAGRKQVHIAAAVDVSEATVNRFERGLGWPRDPDGMIAAYAEEVEVAPLELWARAIDAWRAG